ncbi:GAF domain-containing protein [Desulfopila sp. IMCC35006]|uniref:sensor histidine kinase n=1 Tax=Desulfopila sp. IMCC35006 TaxID=2569542 RepID=UPI0010AD2366|nr:sensor histidine kinase [Desulfopila sp. IMCC35006]TKB23891.1 GAF domain-containing protein [Desulfopila sp. IMCC35006]
MDMSTDYRKYFQAFRDIIRTMHAHDHLNEVLDLVVQKISEVLNAKGALLRLLNQETDQFEVAAAYGIGENYLSKGPVSKKKILFEPGSQSRVHEITDIWNAPRVEYPQQAWDEGVRMMLDVPLSIREKMFGIIRIYLPEKRVFLDDQLDFLLTVAEQCACIIERVRLYENQRTHYFHMAAQLEKMSSLGRMAAGIAHEINNPLTGIMLFSTNLIKKTEEGDRFHEGLQIIIDETTRCKNIVEGLLEFSRNPSPEKKLHNLNDIVTRAIKLVENETQLHYIRIHENISQDLQPVLVDSNQLEQVFVNLLFNAIQAIGEKGEITVKTGETPLQQAFVAVSDTGNGISKDLMGTIFDPFFTTKPEGNGLGLAICHNIVHNHGGDIQVTSKIGKGTTFVVTLPYN